MKTMMNLNENELAVVSGGVDAECDMQDGAKAVEIEGLGRKAGYEVGLDFGGSRDFEIVGPSNKPVIPGIPTNDDELDRILNAPVQLGIGGR